MKHLVLPLLFALAVAGGCKCDDTSGAPAEHSADESGSGSAAQAQTAAPAPGEPGVAFDRPPRDLKDKPLAAQPKRRPDGSPVVPEFMRKGEFDPRAVLHAAPADGGAPDAK